MVKVVCFTFLLFVLGILRIFNLQSIWITFEPKNFQVLDYIFYINLVLAIVSENQFSRLARKSHLGEQEREREGWTKRRSARGGTCEIKGERILEKQKVKKGKAIVACMTWLAPAKYILIKHELRPMRGGAGVRRRWGYTRVNRPHLIFRLCTAQMLRDLHEPRSII